VVPQVRRRPLAEALVQVRGVAQQLARRPVAHQPVQPAHAFGPVDGVERRVPRDVQRLLVIRRVAAQPEAVDERRERVRALAALQLGGSVVCAELVDEGVLQVSLLPGRVPVGVGEDRRAGAAPQLAHRLGGDGGEVGGHLDKLEAAGADDEGRALEDRPAVVAGRQQAPLACLWLPRR